MMTGPWPGQRMTPGAPTDGARCQRGAGTGNPQAREPPSRIRRWPLTRQRFSVCSRPQRTRRGPGRVGPGLGVTRSGHGPRVIPVPAVAETSSVTRWSEMPLGSTVLAKSVRNRADSDAFWTTKPATTPRTERNTHNRDQGGMRGPAGCHPRAPGSRIGAGNGALGQATGAGNGALGQGTGHWGRQSAYPNAWFPTPIGGYLPQCGRCGSPTRRHRLASLPRRPCRGWAARTPLLLQRAPGSGGGPPPPGPAAPGSALRRPPT